MFITFFTGINSCSFVFCTIPGQHTYDHLHHTPEDKRTNEVQIPFHTPGQVYLDTQKAEGLIQVGYMWRVQILLKTTMQDIWCECTLLFNFIYILHAHIHVFHCVSEYWSIICIQRFLLLVIIFFLEFIRFCQIVFFPLYYKYLPVIMIPKLFPCIWVKFPSQYFHFIILWEVRSSFSWIYPLNTP